MSQRKDKKYYNILIMGETGVGKSTLINAVANYYSYEDLQMAENSEPICFIPSKFVITDENLEEETISVGADKNENGDAGQSATQSAQAYVFPLKNENAFLRIIDTPGIADTRGLVQDNTNFEDTLQFIAGYDELHAICFLLKPNNPRITVQFEFCIKHLLSRLEKSASKNIVFIFTNSRGSFYRPGDTLPALKQVIKGIEKKSKNLTIPLSANNVFCLDNEAFRFLMILKHSQVKFTDTERKNFEESWKISRATIIRLFEYIMGNKNKPGLVPHKTKETITINEARRVIIQLAQPLAEISELIRKNLYKMNRHKEEINNKDQTLIGLKKKLHIPQMDIKIEPFPQPRTVCASAECRQIIKVMEINKFHYPRCCHDPCYLKDVPKEVVDCPQLERCFCINKTTKECSLCGCHFSKHMHIYYTTELTEIKICDKNVILQIKDHKTAARAIKQLLENMEVRQNKLIDEEKHIIHVTAKFGAFLKNYAISPYNDVYKSYIDYLIEREQSLGDSANTEIIKGLEELRSIYMKEQKIVDLAIQNAETNGMDKIITTQDIFNSINDLFSLELNGSKIKELYESQNRARRYERDRCEYVHPLCVEFSNSSVNRSKRNLANEPTRSRFEWCVIHTFF